MSFENPTTHFWNQEEAEHYAEFAVTIPSDIAAYQMMYEAVPPKDKIILDYGCFRGNSSIRILQQGAAKVIGIDSVEINIEEAIKNFSIKHLQFIYVPANQPIPSSIEKVDAVYMSFVHPTISSKEILKFTFKKIFDSLKLGGELVLLGLHPASLDPIYSFLFYKHHLLNKSTYEDGIGFKNKLLLPDQKYVEFMDYCWTTSTLTTMLKKIGFTSINEINLTSSNSMLKDVSDQIAKKYKLDWLDEWKAPLYQLFIIKK